MSSGLIDLRSKKAGGHVRKWSSPLPLREKPRSPLRARRRRGRVLIAFGFLAALATTAFGISALSYHPRFAIQSIDVQGAKETRPELIRTYFEKQLFSGAYQFISPTNIFFFAGADIERAIAAYFPRINSVKISRDALLSQAVTVAVEERGAFARWCTLQADECFAMDKTGFIFAPIGSTTESFQSAYVFSGDVLGPPIGKTYARGRFIGILALLDRLGQAGFQSENIFAANEQDFSVRLFDGLLLRLSYGGDVEGVVNNLELVLASDALKGKRSAIDYVDLRFGNRVYYKLKGASAEGKLESE